MLSRFEEPLKATATFGDVFARGAALAKFISIRPIR